MILVSLVASVPLFVSSRPRQRRPSTHRLLIAFLMYVALNAAISALHVPHHEDASTDFFRTESTRWIVQVLNLMLTASIYFIAFNVASRTDGLSRCVRTLFLAAGVLAILGTAQVGLFLTGIAELGIDGGKRLAIVNVGSLAFLRMSSLGGEPKHLACTLLPLAVFVSCLFFYRRRQTVVPKAGTVAAALAACTLLTFSTTAFFAFSVAVPLILIAVRRRITIARTLPVVAVAVSLLAPAVYLTRSSIIAAFDDRVTGRMGEVDYPEAATIEYLTNNPRSIMFGVGWGNIGFYAHHYLDVREGINYLRNNTLPLASSFLRLLSETGIVGVFLFLNFEWILIKDAISCLKQRHLDSPLHVGLLSAAITIIAIQPFNQSSIQWIVFGLLAASTSSLRRAQNRAELTYRLCHSNHHL